MWVSLLLGTALGVGQAAPPDLRTGPDAPGVASVGGAQPVGETALQPPTTKTTPAKTVALQPSGAAAPGQPAPVEIPAAVLPAATPKAAETPTPAAAPTPDRWWLMRQLQGNWLGAELDGNRTSISGWIEGSYTASTDHFSNQPVVWNDRANNFLLNSFWVRLDRAVVTTGTTEPTFGYRADVSMGTDYRFSLQRGLANSQLANYRTDAQGNPVQNLYGIDPIQFYVNSYVPTLFQGTDIRAGRLFTPWGYESLEGISTPFVSRSYAFNWSPPFTHMGIMVSPTFNASWSAKLMLANGNDVFFVRSQEPRFVGAVTYVSPDKRDTATLGWSLGRGKFNTGSTFNPATVGEQSEPAGRNNLNALDFVYSHNFNAALNYSMEAIYGYQTGVPSGVPGGIIRDNPTAGTAHWASVAQYLNYTISPRVLSITRLEFFDDFNGQRTGFKGLYTAITTGFQIRPYKWLLIRPELRYDYNGYSRPFEGHHDILTSALDMIVRY